jgi:hypothetical protein
MPMLSSSHNGERAGAVAAIERVLKGAGLDWHDLTAAITTPLPAASSSRAPPPPPRRPADPGDDLGVTMLDHELVDLVEALRESGRPFTARSEEFLDSMLERAGRFDVVHLSPKQKRWLEDLALKAKGASA